MIHSLTLTREVEFINALQQQDPWHQFFPSSLLPDRLHSTFHGVATETAGTDAVQPSSEAAGVILASCGEQEIYEVFPLSVQSLVCVAFFGQRRLVISVSLSGWRALTLTWHRIPVVIVHGCFGVLLCRQGFLELLEQVLRGFKHIVRGLVVVLSKGIEIWTGKFWILSGRTNQIKIYRLTK